MKQRRALILYATMTGNTEKIATWFKETFEYYNWDVTFFKMSNKADWAGMQDKLYFDDYDVVCLGSPIVAGAPLQIVIKTMSLGGGGALEKEVQSNLDAKKSDAAAAPAKPGAMWRRHAAPYPGVLRKDDHRPLGIVFTTYGGGFYGSSECLATLETLKLYLNLNNVGVVGKFACGGKETGPAGYPLGVKPKAEFRPGKQMSDEIPDADVCDPVIYTLKDGTKKPGSYFFHYDLESKPGPREEAKARAFIADFVEDYFMTYNGERNIAISEIISIS
ncbi:MAG: hypothetical protein ACOX7I_03950 [Oscillospiraceae bacterium]|jgi:hypothetical protein